MAPQTYPAALPFAPIDGTLSGQFEENRLSFKPDVGPALTRPRYSAHFKSVSFDVYMTRVQLAELEQFYFSDCASGSAPFDAPDPYDFLRSAKFSWVSPPNDRAALPNNSKLRVSFSLLKWVIPNA